MASKVFAQFRNVLQIENGDWKENCYLVSSSTNRCIIIDPGSGADFIEDQIQKRNYQPVAIFCTHAHFDHVGAVAELADRFRVKTFLHEADLQTLKQANIYLAAMGISKPIVIPDIDIFPAGGDVYEFVDIKVQVIHTPGHTAGSCAFFINGKLFTGDTIFKNSFGKPDRISGNSQLLEESIDTLQRLHVGNVVFAGHGEPFILANREWS